MFTLIAVDNCKDKFINTILSLIFIAFYQVEIIFKIIGYGWNTYFLFFRFEFITGTAVLIEFLFSMNINENTYNKSFVFLFIKFLKFLPIIRIVVSLEVIQKNFSIIKLILPLILNIIGLFFINLFIFSIMGCFLFRRIKKGNIIDDYVSFKNLFYSMMTLFKMATGDDWSHIMYDTIHPIECISVDFKCNSGNIFI